jgi:serine/threonine protein kinase
MYLIYIFVHYNLIETVDKLQTLYKEADSLKRLNHKYIIKLLYSIPLRSTNSIALIMEYAKGGELKEYLKRKGKLTESESRVILKQILAGLEYCHR